MATPGRKTKLTDERRERFFEAIAAGNTRRASCAYAGFSEDALANYLKKSDFSEQLAQKEAAAEVRNVAIIQKAASETWFAAAWWLERKRPEDWGRRDTLTVLRKLAKEVDSLDDDDLFALATGGADQAAVGAGAGAAAGFARRNGHASSGRVLPPPSDLEAE